MTNNSNMRESDDLNVFLKTRKRALLRIHDDPDYPLWVKVFNYIQLEVKFNEGYVSTSVIKKLAKYFNLNESNIKAAIKKLVDKNYILKYPYGCKRARGYVLNPELYWFGDEKSSNQKIAIYNNTINKLQIEIDTTDNDNVEVVLIDRNSGESVNTKWNKKPLPDHSLDSNNATHNHESYCCFRS